MNERHKSANYGLQSTYNKCFELNNKKCRNIKFEAKPSLFESNLSFKMKLLKPTNTKVYKTTSKFKREYFPTLRTQAYSNMASFFNLSLLFAVSV